MRLGGSRFEARPGKNVCSTSSQLEIAGHSGTCLSFQLTRRIFVQAGLGKKRDPIPKIARTKRDGGMAQVIECLPSKHKALSAKFHQKTFYKKIFETLVNVEVRSLALEALRKQQKNFLV
jgi:hypothetical protein